MFLRIRTISRANPSSIFMVHPLPVMLVRPHALSTGKCSGRIVSPLLHCASIPANRPTSSFNFEVKYHCDRMNQYVADLLIINVFVIGWAISYGSSRFFFGLGDKRKSQLENEILSERPTPAIIREEANTDGYYVWGIRFL